MIIRIVRMSFQPSKVNQFLEVFEENNVSIRNFRGCTHLELHRDVNKPNIFATYSFWEKAEDLEKYRKSELFEKVWSKTKPLFNDKPQAFSHERVMLVEPDDPAELEG
ncbi:MAG: putative quinol monooxygenase [Candidatus Cyclobacteriaceae bacterium M2_1C_046]